MSIPEFEEIVEPNDQTEARRQHLGALRELVGNVYPNKFVRSIVSGAEDTITSLLHFPPIVGIVDEIKSIVATLAERERPPVEIKDELNARLREFGNVRIAGRLAVPPRVMGKAAFVHLSDGMNRLQIYVRRDDVKGVWNGSVPPAVAGGVFSGAGDKTPPAIAGGTDPLYKSPSATAGGAEKNLPADAGAQNGWAIFQLLDHGDFIGVEGYLFITNTGELSVHVETLQFLAKAMLPMPDKMHGIADAEIKQRQRYVDLIGSSLRVESQESGVESRELSTREVFERRAKIISSMRRFLDDHGYIEVETPMLTPKATGAAARPFETHHKALDIYLYARIAPELYLKRLVVGGFEKVYELNRNFRNEGISYKHNPEFTMLEFYSAYMDVEGMMDFCEEMLQASVQKAVGGLNVNYEGNEIDFGKFERVSMRQSILNSFESFVAPFLPQMADIQMIFKDASWIDDPKTLYRSSFLVKDARNRLEVSHLEAYRSPDGQRVQFHSTKEVDKIVEVKNLGWMGELTLSSSTMEGVEAGKLAAWNRYNEEFDKEPVSHGQGLTMLFDSAVEPNLIQPTFIIDYPKSISPLSKASPGNPNIAERFELFINGMEVANGFSELNDPKEQYERFKDQMEQREGGDEEAMVLDEDYIRALSYGMPPAAGIGIGIDRLVMLLTNKHSIRDVILFPHMRPEKPEGEKGSGGEGETENKEKE